VTTEDYEYLARRADPGVGRAKCVQWSANLKNPAVPAGHVQVLLVPAFDESVAVPQPRDLRVPLYLRTAVERYLDQRRLLTAVLDVTDADYVFVSTDIHLLSDPRMDPDRVARAVRARLEQFIHPLRGGPAGDGWPFGRSLTLADIYTQIQTVPGVALLRDVQLFKRKLEDPDTRKLADREEVDIQRGLSIKPTELLCTWEHRITADPIPRPGDEDE
jgi:predicted phage baseplate assembly protein